MMRRTTTTIGVKLPYPINSSTKQTLIPFSTGRGRGRGRGVSAPHFGFNTPPRAPGQPADEAPPKPQEPLLLGRDHGHGRGRGKPLPPLSPVLPSFSSSFDSSGAGRGRGAGASSLKNALPLPLQQQDIQESEKAPPVAMEDTSGAGRGKGAKASSFKTILPPPLQQEEIQEVEKVPPIAMDNGSNLPESIASLLPGVGRGQLEKQPEIQQQVNRHFRPRASVLAVAKEAEPKEAGVASIQPKMSREEALKHAMEVFTRNAKADAGRGRGRGRGMRGRGRGRFVKEGEEDEKETGPYLGDDADGERLAQRLGPEKMSVLTEGFEEAAEKVLPPTIEQAHLDALDMNFKLEFEPEFLMGDLESNPDIDEKPPIPLRDALEKAKPFLMAYENIESQEEWEEVMKETMERVPLLKEIVDHYSGPDRVPAKKQLQELDRVAKTLPASAPNSIKQFTKRAVLSLQSNPGWGFHRKCQFMDKLVTRMSQHYK